MLSKLSLSLAAELALSAAGRETNGKGEIMSDRKRREETPRTLRQLGVPDELGKDLEAAFKAMGKTTGDRIVGFTFVTPEGTRHRLRLEREPSDPAGDRAA